MMNNSMQNKLNRMLAKGIEDIEELGIELYDIIPQVRITSNERRIGSAQDMNRALRKRRGSYETYVITGKSPLFRISISTKECSCDSDIMNVLYHEILHCAPNCQNHQKIWKGYAARVNAAYNANVTVTKNCSTEAVTSANDINNYIGKCFRSGRKTFKFTGFNSRPKNCCDIVEVSTGKRYVCSASYITKMMVESPCLFNATVAQASPSAPSSEIRDFSELVGKKVKNGPRGRKTFTVIAIDPTAGTKAVRLEDEGGNEYYGKIGCAARLIPVG